MREHRQEHSDAISLDIDATVGGAGKTSASYADYAGVPAPVQRRASSPDTAPIPDSGQRLAGLAFRPDLHPVQQIASRGVSGSGGQLPHLDRIQQSFGDRHDLSGISAHVGGSAGEACKAIGAEAYATGNSVAFSKSPDLHTAAHEAAHVVQQRAGVQLKGGVGAVGDVYEQNADAVADRVVQGKSAADLLPDAGASQSVGAVQRKAAESSRATGGSKDVQSKLWGLQIVGDSLEGSVNRGDTAGVQQSHIPHFHTSAGEVFAGKIRPSGVNPRRTRVKLTRPPAYDLGGKWYKVMAGWASEYERSKNLSLEGLAKPEVGDAIKQWARMLSARQQHALMELLLHHCTSGNQVVLKPLPQMTKQQLKQRSEADHAYYTNLARPVR